MIETAPRETERERSRTAPPPAPAPVQRHDQVLALQRSAGNQAVARMLAREPAAAPEAAPAGQTMMGNSLLAANRDKLETVRAESLVRMGRLTKLEGASREAISAVKTRLLETSTEYDKAYSNYARVVNAAKLEAKHQEFYSDIVMGIAIAVLVGLTIEAVPIMAGVTIAAEAAGAGLKAAGKAALKAAPGEAGAEGVEILLGEGAEKLGIVVAGTELAPGGMRPEVLKMGIWKSLTQLHQTAPRVGGASMTMGLLMSNAEYAIGEIKAQTGGGQGDMSEDDAMELVLSVLKAGDQAKAVDKQLDAAEQKVRALQQAAAAAIIYKAPEMERDIWELWMASLDEDSNILDIDAIEDYLGPKGLRLVDFGSYTSDDDENDAIKKAKGREQAIKERRNAVLGARGGDPVGAAERAEPGATDAPSTYGVPPEPK